MVAVFLLVDGYIPLAQVPLVDNVNVYKARRRRQLALTLVESQRPQFPSTTSCRWPTTIISSQVP